MASELFATPGEPCRSGEYLTPGWHNWILATLRRNRVRSGPGSGIRLQETPGGTILSVVSRDATGLIPALSSSSDPIGWATMDGGTFTRTPGTGKARLYDVDEDNVLTLSDSDPVEVSNPHRQPDGADATISPNIFLWLTPFNGGYAVVDGECFSG